MAATRKIDRDFVMSDSSVNVYKFKLLTSGYMSDEFLKNPIGYYMHGTCAEWPRDMGVLVRWEDVRVEGDKLLGKPVVNMLHPRAEQTVTEILNGFLNGASVGDIQVEDYYYEPDPDDADNRILVISKWWIKECSLVDQPGNRSAFITDLYDIQKGMVVNLSDLLHKSNKNMNTVTLKITPELVRVLNLSDNSEQDVVAGIKRLSDDAAKVPGLEKEKSKAVADLADYQKQVANDAVKEMIEAALKAEKITKDLADTLAKDYEGKPEALKKVLGGMKHLSVVDLIDTSKQGADKILKDLADKTWNELDKAGKLPVLKEKHRELYDTKFEERFGHKPTN